MNPKRIHLFLRKSVCCMCAVLMLLSTLSGCESSGTAHSSLLDAVSDVQSVETSVSLDLRGSLNESDTTGKHTVSVRADGTITSVITPAPAYHTEFYSSIMVDSATTRESREHYVVPSDGGYYRYEYVQDSDEWNRTTLSRADALSIPRQTGFLYDWSELMAGLDSETTEDLPDGSKLVIYSGTVPTHVFQEFFGNNVFGSFMYSVEQILEDEISCTLMVDGNTWLPEQLELEFTDHWTVSDMTFDTATVLVTYSNWNKILEVEAPKKVSVGATDVEREFYSTFYAWNLFLPYIGGQMTGEGSAGNTDQSFSATWKTFQLRIDGGMTKIPMAFEDLQKLGYAIDEQYASIVMEPNKYKENIAVAKGADKLYCTFYNDDTVPQPITNCKIGCIDISSSNIPENGIQIYLPEVTLGITKEALVSAYGDPTEITTSFSCDTYHWHGDNDMQSFMAEISPVTGKVIRLQLKNIPVTGGSQS